METRYAPKALKGKMKVPARVRSQLDKKIAAFAAGPEGVHGFARKLIDRPETRIRQGDYRALVLVERDVLLVVRYGHRRSVYED